MVNVPTHSFEEDNVPELVCLCQKDIQFPDNDEAAENMLIAIFEYLDPYLRKYLTVKILFSRVLSIFLEILKNINDHGGKKGYVALYSEYDVLLQKSLLHFVLGDFGSGIKQIAGSFDNFLMDGFSTAPEERGNFAVGGGDIKEYAQEQNIYLVVYDNDETYTVHQPEIFMGYCREPQDKRWGQGAHFVGTVLLP